MVVSVVGRFCAWFLLWLLKLSFWFCLLENFMSLYLAALLSPQPFLSLARWLFFIWFIDSMTDTDIAIFISGASGWWCICSLAIVQNFESKKKCMICFNEKWGHWNSVDWISYWISFCLYWKLHFSLFLNISLENYHKA